MNLKSIIMSLFLIVFCGCTHVEKDEKKYNINFPPELKVADEYISEGKFDDAQLKIDDYLNKSENIHWFGHAYFLKAFLFELKENFPESIKQYRNAIEHTSKYNSKVEAKALYNLSFVYEQLGEMEKLLPILLDLMKRRNHFDPLTGKVETPARLAAVYAYSGKLKEAFIFHREASTQFNEMVRKNYFRDSKEEISKSLYYLGLSVYNAQAETVESLIKKMSLGQKYYLASAEASKGLWAEKSTDRLLNNYNKIWQMIQAYEPEGLDHDPQAKKKQKQMQQLVLAADMYDLIHAIRVEEFPLSNVNRKSTRIMDATSEWLKKLEQFAQNLDLGPDMIRDQPVKQKRLMKYVDKPKVPVRVNKETVKVNKEVAKPSTENEDQNKENEKLPPKTSGDPNL